MKKLIFGIFILSIRTATAQIDTCNCIANLRQTIQKTEANYAGYPAKVNSSYKSLVQRLQQRAAGVSSPKSCYYILREYVRFFNDKHFIVSYLAGKDFDSAVVKPVAGETYINHDSSTIIKLQKFKDGTLKALKVKSSKDSFPVGFVYFTLTQNGICKRYDNFVSTDFPAKQTGGLLRIWNHEIWGKATMTGAEREELKNNNGLVFKKLDADVSYLKVPSFYNNDNKIEKLVASNDSIIRNTKFLIIDLRGNGGGNTGWTNFLPYLMTNPIIQQSALLRVTPDNIKYALPGIEYFVKNPVPADYKKYFTEDVLAKYKKAYEELPTTTAKFYPIPNVNFPLDSITKQPQKVAVIFDNFCGSSTEYFFSLLKQSKKATTYGVHTIGMMDYEGMSTPTPLPYKNFILTIPVSKSHWTDTRPIDKTGFTPEKVINAPEDKWIDYVIDDLKR